MLTTIENNIISTIKKLYNIDVDYVHFEHPNLEIFGDYSTNIALELAAKLKQSPMEIARNLLYELDKFPTSFTIADKKFNIIDNVKIASPGFLNIKFSKEWLINLLINVIISDNNYKSTNKLSNKKIVVEYTDPNPFKIFHIGHLMTNTIGESIARIYEYMGADVKRVNYQGDVGVHVAKSIWGMIEILKKENKNLSDIETLPLVERAAFLGRCYSFGNEKYEHNVQSCEEIKALNGVVFAVAQEILLETFKDRDIVVDYKKMLSPSEKKYDFKQIKTYFSKGKKWSLEYFETLYPRLGTKFDDYYFESMVGELGYKLVEDNLKNGIFENDKGAVIFRGEKFGLHTRVFINTSGLPLYEAKDLGLAFIKYNDYGYDKSIIITGNEINDYFKVVLKAMSLINKEIAEKTIHIGHGMMRFKDGKMSSRSGNVISGEQLLDNIKQKVQQKMIESSKYQNMDDKNMLSDKIAVGCLKYAILKSGIGNNIVYDEDEITNIHGNSGSYLMYTYARINSLIEKSNGDFTVESINYDILGVQLNSNEKDILRYIYRFPEEVEKAGDRLSPNLIAGFLYELTQRYNTFYAKNPILDCKDEMVKVTRLYISLAVAQVIKNGLNLLGIQVVSKM